MGERAIGTPDRPARCLEWGVLVKDWWLTEVWERWEAETAGGSRGPMPVELWGCPPCRRRDPNPWLVTAGTQHAVIWAGCEAAARRAMTLRLRLGAAREGMTVRPADPGDVARWEQMTLEANDA